MVLNMESAEKIYTPKEIADMIGVSPRTIKRRCESREIKGAFRTTNSRSGHWRIPEQSAQAYLEEIGYIQK